LLLTNNCFTSLKKKIKKALDDAWAKGYSVNIILSALRVGRYQSSNESDKSASKEFCKCPKE
jgi:hypothetical protein